MNYAFFVYRWQAYKRHLMTLYQQIKQFGLLFIAVLGTALPSIILLGFLGLGRVIESPNTALESVYAAWLILTAQTVWLYFLKVAIKDTLHRLFQYQLGTNKQAVCADFLLLLISNPFLLASLFLLLTMQSWQIAQAPHFIVFIGLQLISSLLVLYRLVYWVVGLCISLIVMAFLPDNINLLLGQMTFVVSLLAGVAVRAIASKLPQQNGLTNTVNLPLFWLAFFVRHSQYLLWRSALVVSVLMAAALSTQQRPDLSLLFAKLSVSLLLVLTSSLQFSCSALYNKYAVFFLSVNKKSLFYLSHFVPPLVFYMLSVNGLVWLFGFNWFVLVSVFFVLALQGVVAKKPAHFAVAWLVISGCVYFL